MNAKAVILFPQLFTVNQLSFFSSSKFQRLDLAVVLNHEILNIIYQ